MMVEAEAKYRVCDGGWWVDVSKPYDPDDGGILLPSGSVSGIKYRAVSDRVVDAYILELVDEINCLRYELVEEYD